MDMSLREWLVLIGIIVIAVVLIDGYRRMRLAKKRASELSFGLEDVKGETTDEFGSELPNGGARARFLQREKGDQGASSNNLSSHARVEPGLSGMGFDDAGETVDDTLLTSEAAAPSGGASAMPKDVPETRKPRSSGDSSQKTKKTERGFMPRHSEGVAGDMTIESPSRAKDKPSKEKPVASVKKDRSRDGTEKLSDRPPAREVVVINVIAKGDQPFDGAKLLESVLSSGMKFGDMSIFHRYSNDNGTGKILFSMANGVEPGIFSIDNIDGTSTPAVSLFMGMPGSPEPLKAFTKMVETARQLALDLGGELKDEQFSVMTQQTIEHSRQRIIDYERKQLAQRLPG